MTHILEDMLRALLPYVEDVAQGGQLGERRKYVALATAIKSILDPDMPGNHG